MLFSGKETYNYPREYNSVGRDIACMQRPEFEPWLKKKNAGLRNNIGYTLLQTQDLH